MDSIHLKNALKFLHEERENLRAGRLQQVAAFTNQKLQLESEIFSMRLSARDVARIKAAAEKNTELLAAALRGIRTAQDRLAALRSVREGSNVYTQSGGLEAMQSSPCSLERKA